MSTRLRLPALRQRDGHHARVTYEELFFDLVYVFAVTQLSHHLLHHLDLVGVMQTLVLWFAVWLGWQYACWVSNWFDPEAPRIRSLLFVTMLLALLMSRPFPRPSLNAPGCLPGPTPPCRSGAPPSCCWRSVARTHWHRTSVACWPG